MKFNDSFLGFLERFSLRQLLYAWMAVVLVGCSTTMVVYWWVYRYIQAHSIGKEHLTAEYLLLAFTMTGLFLAMVLGLAILRSVTRQVQAMAGMARRLEMRDFKEYPVSIPNGELGEVTRAFLDMRGAIVGYEAELRSALGQLREANKNLGQREAFLRTLVDSASVGILTQDRDSLILSINPFLERLLGYTSNEIVGTHPIVWLAPSDAEAFYRRLSGFYGRPVESSRDMHDAMNVMGPFPPLELNLLRRDGAKVPVMVAMSLLRGADGGSLGRLTVITDLTEIKALEIELREREAEAQAGNRAKSAFLAAMSHEVRTPLIGINGMIEVLSLGSLDNDQRRSVNIIRNSAQSLLRIIGDILDFSKIEAGKLVLAPETISIPKLVEAAVTEFAQTASSKGLQLRSEISDALSPAHVADPVRVNQILNNFMSNAIKFTPKGSITVRVRCLDSTEDAERVIFEVEDTGIGVSEENQASLFHPFSQGESSTTRRFGGTGLGLVICRHLGDLMSGEITMRSEPGKGTTMAFSAVFPIGDVRNIVESELPDVAKTAEFIRPAPSVEEAIEGRSLVLLAEDHPTNREVLSRQLNLAGFALELAKDGLDALEQWKTGRHALVLTDLHMPGMDGYQLTTAIRQWEAAHGLVRTPVIAITANVLQGEAERCLALGMDDYLTKPVSIPVLASKLRQWLPHLQGLEVPQERTGARGTEKQLPSDLDRGALLALCGNDLSAALEILEDFRTAARADLEVLNQCFELRDQDSLARQAHRIQGASAMIGAAALAQKAKELETVAKSNEWRDVEAAMGQVREAMRSLAGAV